MHLHLRSLLALFLAVLTVHMLTAQVTRQEAPTVAADMPIWAEMMYNGAAPESVRQAYETW